MFQAKHPAGHRCQNDELQQETKHRRLDEIHRFPAYEQEQDETSNGIQAQYVAPPDEEIVTQAQQEKPGESATQRRNRSTERLVSFVDQQCACAKKYREKAAHLAIDCDEVKRPHRVVYRCFSTPQTWIDIGHAWHGKGDDVHQQYAHNRKAAHGIKRKEARASGHCSLVTLFGGAAKGRRLSVSLEESCDLLHGSDDGEAADGQDQAGLWYRGPRL